MELSPTLTISCPMVYFLMLFVWRMLWFVFIILVL